MPQPTLDTDLRSPLQIWWEGGRRNGADAMRVFGNRALTSWAGLLLLPGLAVVTLSGLAFGNYWQLHYIAGLSLIPLLLVKLGATTYRALSYYARRAVYRAAGAPEWAGRLLAPALIVSTIIAMATGIWMWSQHSEAQPWAKASCALGSGNGCLRGAPPAASYPDVTASSRARRSRGASAQRVAHPHCPGRDSTRNRAHRWRGRRRPIPLSKPRDSSRARAVDCRPSRL